MGYGREIYEKCKSHIDFYRDLYKRELAEDEQYAAEITQNNERKRELLKRLKICRSSMLSIRRLHKTFELDCLLQIDNSIRNLQLSGHDKNKRGPKSIHLYEESLKIILFNRLKDAWLQETKTIPPKTFHTKNGLNPFGEFIKLCIGGLQIEIHTLERYQRNKSVKKSLE